MCLEQKIHYVVHEIYESDYLIPIAFMQLASSPQLHVAGINRLYTR
jgi:hypothetical protein